jgi:hypothetical protein
MPRSTPFRRSLAPFILGVALTALCGATWLHLGQDTTDRTSRTAAASRATECPTAPGFTGTRAANERATNCETALAVEDMLLESGAASASVVVTREATDSLLGPATATNLVAAVDLPQDVADGWDARAMARTIGAAVGTPADRVQLVDEDLRPLTPTAATEAVAVAAPRAIE